MTEPAAAPAIDKDAPNVPLPAAQLQAIAQSVVADPRRVEDLVAANAALTKQLEQAEVRLGAYRTAVAKARAYCERGVAAVQASSAENGRVAYGDVLCLLGKLPGDA